MGQWKECTSSLAAENIAFLPCAGYHEGDIVEEGNGTEGMSDAMKQKG
jgi:hypothetical protein